MNIEVKHEITETVWTMSNNKAISAQVMNFRVDGNKGNLPPTVSYFLNIGKADDDESSNNVRIQKDVFKTKEELLSSL